MVRSFYLTIFLITFGDLKFIRLFDTINKSNLLPITFKKIFIDTLGTIYVKYL